jgi:hypothetical protein
MAENKEVKEKVVYVERKRRIGCLPVLGIVVLIAIVGAAIYTATGGGKSTPTVASGPAPALAAIAAQKKALTDAQWDSYADGLKGKQIKDWPGTVQNVDQKPLSDLYTVTVDTADPVPGYAFDVKLDVSKDDALKIKKGQAIAVSGVIKQVNCALTYCPIELDSASFVLK